MGFSKVLTDGAMSGILGLGMFNWYGSFGYFNPTISLFISLFASGLMGGYLAGFKK